MTRTMVGMVGLLGVVALGLVAGCGKDEGGDAEVDFSAAALEPVEVDVKGQKVSVSVPKGFTLEDGPFVRLRAPAKEHFSLPSFTLRLVTLGAPESIEALKLESGTKAKPMAVTKREAVAGGLLIAGHNSTKGTVELTFFKPRPEGGAVSCRAVQARSEGVPNPEATLAMFERACTSLTLK